MITVLLFASSPVDQGPLQLGKELKQIKHSLDSAINRDQFRIISCPATTVDDLRRYLLEHSPSIVHFCGHGGGNVGLCFEDDHSETHTVNGDRLAKLFHLVNEDVRCIVLNACLSDSQAQAISKHIDFVVGMSAEIGDLAALKFSQGFYEAIWAGQSYEKAFKFGCSAIDTANIPQEHIPVIYKSPRLGGTMLEYHEDTQSMENVILQFSNASGHERAVMTTQGEAVLAKFSKDTPLQKWTSASVVSVKAMADSYLEVRTTMRRGLDSLEHFFYLKECGETFLVDWEASMGYWPIPIKTYKSLGSRQLLRIRVKASLGDYFNYGFERDQFINIDLEHLTDGRLNGYISHFQKDKDRLIELLFDGKEHRIIVDVIQSKRDTSSVLITDLVSTCWIAPDGTGDIS